VFKLWVKGVTPPHEMREKAKSDPRFLKRLLCYIAKIMEECIPDVPIPDADSIGARIFQPFVKPTAPDFERNVAIDIDDIVRSRQMHNKFHMPTCFKYGSTKCRARFPRNLVEKTTFDAETSVFRIRRNSSWVNNYNKWISLMTRANHDCQILFTQNHALAITHYVFKYITKPEKALHAKLTIGAAVRKAMAPNSSASDDARLLLLKIYNKLDAYREVGVPEIISHLLDYPDHYTSGFFVNIHTTHLLYYVKRSLTRVEEQHDSTDLPQTVLDAPIVVGNSGGFVLCSLFDDYAHRGHILSDYCLYDYCATVYKKTRLGIPFDDSHPQYASHYQILRTETVSIPTLLGRLLFLNRESEKADEREDYYCLMSFLFFPWKSPQELNTSALSWQQFFALHSRSLHPRILRYITNLDLLHKTTEETKIDWLQRQVQDESQDEIQNNCSAVEYMRDLDNDQQFMDDAVLSSALREAILQSKEPSTDTYTADGVEAASQTYVYFNKDATTNLPISNQQETNLFSTVPLSKMRHSFQQLQSSIHNTISTGPGAVPHEQEPTVYLTDESTQQLAIDDMIRQFSLNEEQSDGFKIIANHTLERGRGPKQLLMAIFGAAGRGKSTLMKAVQRWMGKIGRADELMITATTGAASSRIRGVTLHSVLGLGRETGDRTVLMSKEKKAALQKISYLVIDEISMMDSLLMEKLHLRLCVAKASKGDVTFGGINIIYLGDFLQLPSVSAYHLYTDTPSSHQGYRLWRSLNAVVILVKAMRQITDPPFADLLDRLSVRQPTEDDFEVLRSRTGAPLPANETPQIIVRRHGLRHILNAQMADFKSKQYNRTVVYCFAQINSRKGMNLRSCYALRHGDEPMKGDAILPLFRGTPLMITRNIEPPLSMIPKPSQRKLIFMQTLQMGLS